MKITIQYFAKLREERGCSYETIDTESSSASELYQELRDKYKFTLDYPNLKVAVNEEFSNWETALKDNDTVVFIQPVAGG